MLSLLFHRQSIGRGKQIVGVDDNKLYTDGYRIYTTMDRELQEFCQRILDNDSFFPQVPTQAEDLRVPLYPFSYPQANNLPHRWKIDPEDQRKY